MCPLPHLKSQLPLTGSLDWGDGHFQRRFGERRVAMQTPHMCPTCGHSRGGQCVLPRRSIHKGKSPAPRPWGSTCQPLPLEQSTVAVRTCVSENPRQLQRGLCTLPALISEGDLLTNMIRRNMDDSRYAQMHRHPLGGEVKALSSRPQESPAKET